MVSAALRCQSACVRPDVLLGSVLGAAHLRASVFSSAKQGWAVRWQSYCRCSVTVELEGYYVRDPMCRKRPQRFFAFSARAPVPQPGTSGGLGISVPCLPQLCKRSWVSCYPGAGNRPK